MDLVYIPEVLSYGCLRNVQYRDYEQPWNRDYFDDGRTVSVVSQRQQQYQHHSHNQQQQRSQSKDQCQLCKESKMRSLAAYIRGKTRKSSCTEIYEADEDVEEENASSGAKTCEDALGKKSNSGEKETKQRGKRDEVDRRSARN
ncbi:uncharacterized protein LOC105699890 [Orussus abietinus]|uniref:uncharacterized protein LOC105699890 n=1 Tax=Orussus abietinus TaxID=222816 RepID=UPI00062689F0|nr:uncharacterized protein LOC105699890 [Orussus abietinus]